ncbi:MAG TPA: hypothetical protein VGW40_07730 [Allosphingosinicella sp.]|nr:hypothetical protein [Allosphingosinicella sp.]
MERRERNAIAGGCLIPISILGGLLWGADEHQLSLGFLIGLGIGLGLAVLVWLVDRLRD